MNAKEQFDKISKNYDSQRKTLIPNFDDFYCAPLPLLQFDSPNPHILDMGAGTGILAGIIAKKFPLADFTLEDLSENMLAIGEQRMEVLGANCKLIVEDFRNFNADNEYDAIVSALAIHHIEDDEKQKLYRAIHKALKPNGIFINCEQILGETDALIAHYSNERLKIVAEHMSAQEGEIAKERLTLDRCASVKSQLQWLSKIGFADTACIYRYLDFAVLYAKKYL